MESPQLIKLNYHDTSTISTIKLNNDLVKLLLTDKPKLIVKNGKKFIKVKDFIYNLQESKEFLNLNIYEKVDDKNYNFQGNVLTKLTVGNEKVSINDFEVREGKEPVRGNEEKEQVSVNIESYKVKNKDDDILGKFFSFMALGPTNIRKLSALNYDFSDYIGKYCSNFEQSPNNLHNDNFANGLKYLAENNLLLKDKIMKDLRPNSWSWVGEEKEMMFRNINGCLTRLGYSGSHPLRKRIYEKEVRERSEKSNVEVRERSEKSNIEVRERSEVRDKTEVRDKNTVKRDPEVKRDFVKREVKRDIGNRDSVKDTGRDSIKNEATALKTKKPALKDTPKRKRSDSDNTSPSSIEDFFIDDDLILNLQKKFDVNYKEYKALYQYLKMAKRSNEVSQLTKLYELHNYCNEVKNQLIKVSKEKRRRIK